MNDQKSKKTKQLLKEIEPEIYKNSLATTIYSNLFIVEKQLGENGLRKSIPYILRQIKIPKSKAKIKEELEKLAIVEDRSLNSAVAQKAGTNEEYEARYAVKWAEGNAHEDIDKLKNAFVNYRLKTAGFAKALGILNAMKPSKVVYNNIGCVFYKKVQHARALEYFSKALDEDPDFLAARYNRGLSYASLENYPRAIDDFSAAFVISNVEKEKAEILYLRGIAYEYSDQYEKAVADFKKAIEILPKFPEAKAHLEAAKGKMDSVGKRTLVVQNEANMPTLAHTIPSIDFSGVGGMHEIKKLLRLAMIEPLRNPKLAQKYNKKLSGGYLLYGPPGCGKSFLAEAVAGEAKMNFIRANIHDILNMYVGNSEKNLVAIFEEARRNQPALVFFDEIEALGGRREGLDQHWQKTIVNVFLQEMDRIERNNEKIVVFGATNAPWELDIALRRSGRFGKEVFVSPPDEKSRKEILEIYSKNLPLENVDLSELASLTSNLSAANLKSICEKAANRAWEDAVNGNERKITMEDFREAIRTEKSDVKEWMNLARKLNFNNNLETCGKERMYG